MSKKSIYITIGIIAFVGLGIYGVIKFAIAFSPGSYPYAEIYTLNFPENSVQNAIKNVKIKNSKLLVADSTFTDDTIRKVHWIHNYYNLNNRTIHTWTRAENDSVTYLAFVSVSDSISKFNWENINKDFSKYENDKLKKEFEINILYKIKQELNKK